MKYMQKNLNDIFSLAFGSAVPENLNIAHNIVIVASEFDASSKRIVEYLSEVHGVNINTLFFSTFDWDGKLMIGADWLIDQEEVAIRSRREKAPETPWSGFWYVNVDECKEWSWEDCRMCGFMAASGARIFSGPLKKLDIGVPVFAYQKSSRLRRLWNCDADGPTGNGVHGQWQASF